MDKFFVLADKYKFDIPPKSEYGDFAFPIFDILKNKDKDLIIENIKNELYESSVIQYVYIISGFINIRLDKKKFFYLIYTYINDDEYFEKIKKNNGNIMVEYVSPNLNKSLSIGHLRNFCIGMSLCNILESTGYKPIHTILYNDRGIHICKAMLAYKKWGENQYPNIKSDIFVGQYYTLFDIKNKEEAKQKNIDEDSTDLINESRKMLIDWENNNQEVHDLWIKITKWTLDGIEQTMKEFGSRFEKIYFESDFWDKGRDLVLDAFNKNICYKTIDGAIEIDLTDKNLDKKILLRNDGTTLYITQDLYTTYIKFKENKIQKSIWVVGREQEYHFKVLFEICERFGIAKKDDCYHLSYGMVTLRGKKMKSRSGEKVDWDDLYENIIELVDNNTKDDLFVNKDEKLNVVKKIAQSAIKFNMLLSSTNKDIDYDPEKSISIYGKTGPYILYTMVRIKSLLKNIINNNIQIVDIDVDIDDYKFSLIRHLYMFENKLYTSLNTYSPHTICNYTFELCELFNSFYEQEKIIINNTVSIINYNVLLITKKILSKCLDILNIEEVDKM